MRFQEREPPREFEAGGVTIRDCGRMHLEPDEQITFVTPDGKGYDVAAKSWGFYATPSLAGRLKREGFRTALVANREGKHFVMLVDASRMGEFESYLAASGQEVVEWLDDR